MVWSKSDTVILLGTPVDFRLGYGADSMFPQNPRLIEIMMDGSKIGQNRDIDVGVAGNSKAVLRQIMDELRATGLQVPRQGMGRRGHHGRPGAEGSRRRNAEQRPVSHTSHAPDERTARCAGQGCHRHRRRGRHRHIRGTRVEHQRAGTLAGSGTVRLLGALAAASLQQLNSHDPASRSASFTATADLA